MDTLIANVTLVTMNEKMETLFGAYLGITDGKIAYIGKTAPEDQPETIIDGTGMVAIPGLVNCHTHLPTAVLRNFLDDSSKAEALEQLLLRQSKIDERAGRAAIGLAIAECLRFGITSVSDLYYSPDVTAQVVADAGMKANIALAATRFVDDSEDFDFDTDPGCKMLADAVEKWHNYDHGRIKIDAGIHAEFTSNHQLWDALSAYAAEQGLGLQMHLAESAEEVADCEERTGLTQAELLNCHGVFRVPVTAASCAHLTETEQKLLGKAKASAVALPIAAAKQGYASTPITDCVKNGMNVALGTDSAVASGNLDLFEVMRFVALQARQAGGDSSVMPAVAPLMMATVCGARAQGRGDECGMLKEGMDADIVLVDFSAPHLMPCHNVVSGLVFSAKGGDVAMTMVRGKILYQNGQFPTLDLNAIVSDIMAYAIPKVMEKETV
ncbi:MAG: amidohydrolase family protein [Oscillospiraceae bacterium]|nr:amidohydrolase family protein [Oscillospiraceae bacterium]